MRRSAEQDHIKVEERLEDNEKHAADIESLDMQSFVANAKKEAEAALLKEEHTTEQNERHEQKK
mgnify:CR=1 FL=1